MEIQDFYQRIQDIPQGIERKDFVATVKQIESEALSYCTEQNELPWEKGRGFLISQWLTGIKDRVILKMIDYFGGLPNGVAILAVGGYGRAEMSPHSDVDILVLHRESYQKTDFINSLFYLLWDVGYKLGNSVRTIANVREHSAQDITFLTSIFESRIIAGDRKLSDEMYQAIQKILTSTREDYIKNRVEEVHQLSRNLGNSVLLKEPHLKEGAGGLRSVHYAQWMNFAFNGKAGFEHLSDIMDTHRYHRVYAAYDFILYIRNMLHFMNNRKEDILLIDYHTKVAENLRLEGDRTQKVEQLMKRVYDSSLDIFVLSSFAIDRIFINQFKKKIKKINRKYSVLLNEFLVEEDLAPSVENAFEAVWMFAKGNYYASYSLLHYLDESSRLITVEHRNSKKIFNQFIDILSLENSFNALNIMKLSDMLYRYIPELEKVRHFIIYNPFHQFTVDEHSIEAVRGLEMLFYQDYSSFEKGKMAGVIEVAKKHQSALWVIKLALILHDIGKAYPGDHSKNGVGIAHRVFSEMPLMYRYREIIEFLIENHLLLSHIIRRSDIQNMDVVMDLSRKFVTSPYPADYLDYIYLLSYADIYATNSTNFSGYISTLLSQLYNRTHMVLAGKIGRDYQHELFQEKLSNLMAIVEDPEIKDFAHTLGQSYINQQSEEETVADFALCRSTQSGEPRLEVRNFNEFLKIKFYAPDRLGLFALFSGVLLANGANIVKAHIFTYRSVAFDVFLVTEIFGSNLSQHSMKSELSVWIEGLERSLQKFYLDSEGLSERIQTLRKRIRRIPDIFHKEAAVNFHPEKDGRCLVTVSGSDRPALLYDVASYFAKQGMSIQTAIIDTVGWNIQDSFYIQPEHPFTDAQKEEHQARLKSIMETDNTGA